MRMETAKKRNGQKENSSKPFFTKKKRKKMHETPCPLTIIHLKPHEIRIPVDPIRIPTNSNGQ